MATATISPGLEKRIRAILEEKSMLKHPFYVEWANGSLPLATLREYARQYYPFEAAFPRYLSSIHARTDSAEIRQLLLDNLWDEEHGDRNHPVLWLEFAAALGLSADEVKKAKPRPETQALVDHYNRTSRESPLAEALATLFAYEGQVPAIAWQKIKGLTEHYNFEPRQFEFFSVHLVADIAHAGAEMDSIGIACEDEDGVARAVEIACDLLIAFLDGCYGKAAA